MIPSTPAFDFLRVFVLQTYGFSRGFCDLDLWRNSLSLNSFLGFLMSTSKDRKHVSTPKVVSMMSKITKDKPTGVKQSAST